MLNNTSITIPKGLIVFVSGVPGVGKTTISYELLRRYSQFRIIEETDLIREILRGYNDFLINEFGDNITTFLKRIKITDHTQLLSYEDAKIQCSIMRCSIEHIISRQQRKGIPSIINGVHIIPEILCKMTDNNVIYINLFVTDPEVIRSRIFKRNPKSYMLSHIPFIYQSNKDLLFYTRKIELKQSNVYNIDVTNLNIDETIERIASCIKTIPL